MKKFTNLNRTVFAALAIAGLLTACNTKSTSNPNSNYSYCQYSPWTVEEHQLFGLTQKQIESKYQIKSQIDGDTTLGRFNVEYDKAGKVCAVRRFFIGCKATYYGPWLQSKKDALNYSINGMAEYRDKDSITKRAALKELLAKVTEKDQSIPKAVE